MKINRPLGQWKNKPKQTQLVVSEVELFMVSKRSASNHQTQPVVSLSNLFYPPQLARLFCGGFTRRRRDGVRFPPIVNSQ